MIKFRYLTYHEISSLIDAAELLYNKIECYYILDIPKKYQNLRVKEYKDLVACVHKIHAYLDSGDQRGLFRYCQKMYGTDTWEMLGHNIYNLLFKWIEDNQFDLNSSNSTKSQRKILWTK